MFSALGIECQNEKLFLGAAESDVVEGSQRYWRSSTEPVPSMMTISIRPYIRPTSRTTAALTSGGGYAARRISIQSCSKMPITTSYVGTSGVMGLLGWGYARFCK